MNRFPQVFFLRAPVIAAASVLCSLLSMSCTKRPEVDAFKQIQLNWIAADEAAENAEQKDNCVIEITSKVMRDSVVLASKLVEIAYDVVYSVDENGGLVFVGRCGDSRFSDFKECSWQTTCGGGSVSVVKFHNER